MDDRKELLARAEIMNRVYQRDISNLDTEIQRLERILTKELHVSISTLDEVTIIEICYPKTSYFNMDIFIIALQLSYPGRSQSRLRYFGPRTSRRI